MSLAKQLSLHYVHQHQRVSDETLKQMGQALWPALDIESTFNAAKRQAGLKILPILIESNSATFSAYRGNVYIILKTVF